MTDGQGRTVDFKNTVIVMTSNLGSHLIQDMEAEGVESGLVKVAVMDEVRRHFRPEFINRIDETIVFHGLDEKNIGSIAKIQLAILEKRLESMEMSLEISEKALQKIAEAGFDPLYGARPLKRAIQHQIENPVSKLILEGKYGPKDTIVIDEKNGELVFDKKTGA